MGATTRRCGGLSLQALFAAALTCSVASAAELTDMAERADWPAVKALIEAGTADVNDVQADGTSALIWAAYHGDSAAARMLIDAGADVHARNRLGMSAMSQAAGNGSGDIVLMLLDAGADANAAMPEGDSALMLASRSGSLEAVRALIEGGADVNAVESFHGETALMWAAAQNHADVVRLLLEHGAEVDAVSKEFKWEDLTQTGVASYLPLGGLTALLHAARENGIDAARVLLEHGADPNAKNPIGIGPLRVALTNDHWDLASLLLDHGADPSDALVEAARTRAYPIVRAAVNRFDQVDSLELIREMLEAGADPNAVPEEPMSMQYWTIGKFRNDPPLFIAAREADLELMALLAEHGAETSESTNKDGATVLMAALGFTYHQLGGGVPSPPRDGQLAISIADAALGLGADIDAGKNDGMTALHMAAERGRDDLVQYLIEHGAQLDIKDDSNRTALDVALAVPAVKKEGEMPAMPPPPPVLHESTANLLREAMAEAGVAIEPYLAPEPDEASPAGDGAAAGASGGAG